MSKGTVNGVSRELLECLAVHVLDESHDAAMRAKAKELRAQLDAPECCTTTALACPGDGVGPCKECPGDKGMGETVEHTMKSVMSAICGIEGFPMLTSNQCYSLAVRLNNEQPEQRARALLAEVVKGEPEAYRFTFYQDCSQGPQDMAEWVERVRLELGK